MRFSSVKIIFIGAAFLCLPFLALADQENQQTGFSVDPQYDAFKRDQVTATLITITPHAYFYVENDWRNPLDDAKKQEVLNFLNGLAGEFENKIYPTLTATFGYEWKPGIDNDERITILIHQMPDEVGGYFNSGDEYFKAQNSLSNQREMLYFNAKYLDKAQGKNFLAHEFFHLINYNQKEKLFSVQEDIWLNEARAEYVSTLLNYDSVYETSNLQRRIRNFLDKPNDSLTEWQGKAADYGALNLFTQYLVDHYGLRILTDSLKMRKAGIDSLNEALKQQNAKENFAEVFTNWTIALLINDCQYGERYCYLNSILKNFRVVPLTHFLPIMGESSLSVTYTTKDWAGNWYKILGGRGVLKFEFSGGLGFFRLPYIIEDSQGSQKINFLALDANHKGTIYIPDFNNKSKSLVIIPSLQGKTMSFGPEEPSFLFSFAVATVDKTPEQEAELMNQLLAQIEFLKNEIKKVQAQLDVLLAARGEIICPLKFESDLYYGITGSLGVKCLQKFLKNQGAEIYPEGLVTGNFLFRTSQAVKRYQALRGLPQTGYFGPMTRTAANGQ